MTKNQGALIAALLAAIAALLLADQLNLTEPGPTQEEEVDAILKKHEEQMCEINLAHSWDELTEEGRADRIRCLRKDD